MRIAVIGVPFNSSGQSTGEALAPAVLRDAGLIPALAHQHDVVDYGDASFAPPRPERDPRTQLIAPDSFAAMVTATRDAVARAFAEDRMPLVLGGECPLLLGCLAAVRDVHGPTGLLFIDGHEDAYAPSQSTTGETADMALGFATGITRPDRVDNVLELLPVVHPAHVAILGARDREALQSEGVASVADRIATYPDEVVRETSLGPLMKLVMEGVRRDTASWWLHLDLDVLSSDALSAVRYPQPHGLGWEHLEQITAHAFASPGPRGWNVTIYNPDLDPDREQAGRIVRFVTTASRQLLRQPTS